MKIWGGKSKTKQNKECVESYSFAMLFVFSRFAPVGDYDLPVRVVWTKCFSLS